MAVFFLTYAQEPKNKIKNQKRQPRAWIQKRSKNDTITTFSNSVELKKNSFYDVVFSEEAFRFPSYNHSQLSARDWPTFFGLQHEGACVQYNRSSYLTEETSDVFANKSQHWPNNNNKTAVFEGGAAIELVSWLKAVRNSIQIYSINEQLPMWMHLQKAQEEAQKKALPTQRYSLYKYSCSLSVKTLNQFCECLDDILKPVSKEARKQTWQASKVAESFEFLSKMTRISLFDLYGSTHSERCSAWYAKTAAVVGPKSHPVTL